jgi:hypothetical protein
MRATNYLVLVGVVTSACAGHDMQYGRAPTLTPVAFTHIATRTGTMTPSQGDTAPIIRVSGFTALSNGEYAIADVSESNVKLFAPTGALQHVFGTRGAGATQFDQPRFARVDSRGRLHVLDVHSSRISVFDPRGNLVRTIDLPSDGMPTGMVLWHEGYIIAGRSPETQDVLTELDSAGRVIGTALPIRDVLPAGARHSPAWFAVRAFSLAIRNDSAFVVSSVSDSLWTVDLVTNRMRAEALPIAGYRQPATPEHPLKNAVELEAWARSSHMAAAIYASPSLLMIPYVAGVLNYGDSSIVMIRIGTKWMSVVGAPPIVAVSGDTAIAIDNPRKFPVQFGRYRVGT